MSSSPTLSVETDLIEEKRKKKDNDLLKSLNLFLNKRGLTTEGARVPRWTSTSEPWVGRGGNSASWGELRYCPSWSPGKGASVDAFREFNMCALHFGVQGELVVGSCLKTKKQESGSLLWQKCKGRCWRERLLASQIPGALALWYVLWTRCGASKRECGHKIMLDPVQNGQSKGFRDANKGMSCQTLGGCRKKYNWPA